MRVLMLSWEYPPHVVGGLGQHVADLAPALARRGVEVHVVTPMRQGGDCAQIRVPCTCIASPYRLLALPICGGPV